LVERQLSTLVPAAGRARYFVVPSNEKYGLEYHRDVVVQERNPFRSELMRNVAARIWLLIGLGLLLVPISAGFTQAGQKPKASQQKNKKSSTDRIVPVNKQKTVLVDVAGKRVLLKTKVVLREGLLEMFCCLKQTKEHESILAVDSKAYTIHTALLAIGAKPGRPAQFVPKYQPPTGQRIDIFVQWTDTTGKLHRSPAQRWIRHATRRFYAAGLKKLPAGFKLPPKSELRYDEKNHELTWYGQMAARQRDALLKLSNDRPYQKAIRSFFKQSQPRPMRAHWIFTGSRLVTDRRTGKNSYQAEGGDLICVSNFATAMIDVDVRSSASAGEGLLFEPDPTQVPPLGTLVTVELIPFVKKKPSGKK